MPVNDMAQRYLDTFAAGGDFPGGLAFRKALGQVDLDYTPESLGRIDALLRQMHDKLRPRYAEFVEKQENQNFLYLLCFYAGTVVIRYTKEDYAWYPYDELKQVAPPDFLREYPDSFASSMVCMLKDGSVYLPLSSMLDILFDDGSDRSVLASADKFMRRMTDARPMERPDAPVPFRDDVVTQSIRATCAFAGWAAAFGIFMVGGGQPMARTLQHEFASGRRLGISLMHGTLEDAFKRLEINAEGALRSVLIYQGVVGLPAFRSEALVLEARSFQPPRMTLTIVVPFRPASPTAGFATYRPRLLRPTDLGDLGQRALVAGFFEGADTYQPTGLLDRHLVEDHA